MMSVTTKMCKTDHGFITKFTYDNCPTWRKKIHYIPIAMRVYNMVTGDKLLSKSNRSAVYTLWREWCDQRAMLKAFCKM